MKIITIQAYIEHGQLTTLIPIEHDGIYTITVEGPTDAPKMPTRSILDGLIPLPLIDGMSQRFGRDELYDEYGR